MDDADAEDSLNAYGWDAIDAALQPLYGTQEPRHWGPVMPWALGGPDPIRGISAYRSDHGQSHLHYVTYGISELYEKESDDPDVSGYGFELTFRLARDASQEPPNWVLNFLQNLGRYVFQSGHAFGVGHTLSLNGPIEVGSDTQISAITFGLDPELGRIETPNGRVDFLQIVGLADKELDAVQYWNAERFLELVGERNPLWITDTTRQSLLADPGFRSQVERFTAEEGASCPALYSENVRFTSDGQTCRLILGAIVTPDLSRRLAGRIPYCRDFTVYADEVAICFEPGESFRIQLEVNGLTLAIPLALLDRFRGMLAETAGIYRDTELPGLTIVVEKTEITDRDGNVTEIRG